MNGGARSNGGGEPYAHLSESTQRIADAADEVRIAHVAQPRWISYARAQTILAKLEDLYRHPKTHRMPNLLIVGDTNNGKTMLVKRFAKLHPAFDRPDADSATAPVVIVQAPGIPDESRFYGQILDALHAPHRQNDRAATKLAQVLALLRTVNLKVLVVDELQIVMSGHPTQQRHFLNHLKFLANELEIPIVGVGTADAHRAIQTDPQLSNRFVPAHLPLWKEGDELSMLLRSFERHLPLRSRSALSKPSLAKKILYLSGGIIGEIAGVLSAAAIFAIRNGAEQIDAGILESIDWIVPSERRPT